MTLKTNEKLQIRDSRAADVKAIHRIYEEQVLNGISSWEEIPPTLNEMQERRSAIFEKGYPFLVGEIGDQVVGYAYAGPYRSRSGYRYTVEHSIYVDKTYRHNGTGASLMKELICRCEALGFRQMIAVIGGSDNHTSIEFHTKMGFSHAGTLRSIGYKFDHWMDSVIMQRALGSGEQTPPGQLKIDHNKIENEKTI